MLSVCLPVCLWAAFLLKHGNIQTVHYCKIILLYFYVVRINLDFRFNRLLYIHVRYQALDASHSDSSASCCGSFLFN